MKSVNVYDFTIAIPSISITKFLQQSIIRTQSNSSTLINYLSEFKLIRLNKSIPYISMWITKTLINITQSSNNSIKDGKISKSVFLPSTKILIFTIRSKLTTHLVTNQWNSYQLFQNMKSRRKKIPQH